MTALLLVSFVAVVVVGLMLAAARDAFRQSAQLGWTASDDAELGRLLRGDCRR